MLLLTLFILIMVDIYMVHGLVTGACPWSLQWRHNEHDGFSNHRRPGSLLKRLFRRRSKKTSKFRVTGLCERNPPVTGGSPHKGPVTREWIGFSSHQTVSCWQFGITPLPDPVKNYCQLGFYEQISVTFQPKVYIVSFYSGLYVLMLSAPLVQYPRMVRVF